MLNLFAGVEHAKTGRHKSWSVIYQQTKLQSTIEAEFSITYHIKLKAQSHMDCNKVTAVEPRQIHKATAAPPAHLTAAALAN